MRALFKEEHLTPARGLHNDGLGKLRGHAFLLLVGCELISERSQETDQDGAAKTPAVDRGCQLSDRASGEVDLIPPVAGHDRALLGGSVELMRVSERDCGDFV